MKILFVGDVVGKPGRALLTKLLPGLVDQHLADYVVVNIENAAGGFGITPEPVATTSGTSANSFPSSTESRASSGH